MRAVLQKGFYDSVNSLDADVICLQEIKMQKGQCDVELPGLPTGYVWKLYVDTGKNADKVICEHSNILLHDRRIKMQGRSVIALVAEKLW